mgnify:CR=1 FL=1
MKIEQLATFLTHFAIISYIFFVAIFILLAISALVYAIHNILYMKGFIAGLFLSAFAVFLFFEYKILKRDIEDVKKGIK